METLQRVGAALGLLFLVLGMCQAAAPASQFFVYVGTYTGAKSKGIYVCRLDAATGKLSGLELAAETANPTFLAVHPLGSALYAAGRPVLLAANEIGGRGQSGTVSGYGIDRATGQLTFLNRQSSRGAGPCHLSVDGSGRHVLVANYGDGTIAALPLQTDGRLGEATGFVQHTGSSVNKRRQEGPHAHWIDLSPDGRYVLACDLGLDKVLVYKLDASAGTLAPHDPPFARVAPRSGPRHLAFHPKGRFAYVINELASTMTAFAYDSRRSTLTDIQTLSTLPEGFTNQNSTAEVEVHPSGRYLYGSNRGHDSIVVHGIDQESGKLNLIEHQPTRGRTPRNFAIDPTGQWLLAANQGTDSVVVFRVDPQTGRLTPNGETVSVGAPVCLKFVPVK